MSTPKPKPQPNRHQRRALQRASEPTTMTTTATTTHSAHHTCAELGVCNSRTPACKANQCQQGRAACPVPQACEVAERPGVAGLDWGHPWAPLGTPRRTTSHRQNHRRWPGRGVLRSRRSGGDCGQFGALALGA